MRFITKAAALAATTIVMTATAASASVSFDPATGTGFVGKGDVQLALGLNNSQVQSATVAFSVESITTQVTTWTCLNENNEQTQERARTTTSELAGVVTSVARVKNQITGYNLIGYSGAVVSSTSSDGPKLYSCPNANSSYVLDSIDVGEPVVTGGGLLVNGVPLS